MTKKDIFTKFLVIIGTALAWFPLLAPILFSLALLVKERIFRFDYLMPAELFPATLVGGGLLILAAFRLRSQRRLVGWALAVAAASLVGGQLLAVVTGLASGETQPVGLWWLLVLASLGVYTLACATIGVGGLFLLRDLSSS